MKRNTVYTVIAGIVGYVLLTRNPSAQLRAEYHRLAASGVPLPDFETWKRLQSAPPGSGRVL